MSQALELGEIPLVAQEAWREADPSRGPRDPDAALEWRPDWGANTASMARLGDGGMRDKKSEMDRLVDLRSSEAIATFPP